MVLRLDPRFPLLWRTPHSLQFGLDRPRVVLEAVSPADERVIAALVTGVSRSGAQMIGRSAGLDDTGLSALLRTLEPALELPVPTSAPASAVVIGSGETVELVTRLLHKAGIAVLPEQPDAVPEIAVIVAHFAIEPEVHGHWLRRDIPHIGVVFSDEVVRIGPIIRPGTGPCLYCLELHHTDSDPSWPAMASQLWQRRSAAESPLVAGEVATIVARMVLSRQAVHRIVPTATIEIDVATGDRSLNAWGFHPDCGCASLSG